MSQAQRPLYQAQLHRGGRKEERREGWTEGGGREGWRVEEKGGKGLSSTVCACMQRVYPYMSKECSIAGSMERIVSDLTGILTVSGGRVRSLVSFTDFTCTQTPCMP